MCVSGVADSGILQLHPCLTSKARETGSIFAELKQTTRWQHCGCGRLRAETKKGGRLEQGKKILHQRPSLPFSWNLLFKCKMIMQQRHENELNIAKGKKEVPWKEKSNLILHNFFLVTF